MIRTRGRTIKVKKSKEATIIKREAYEAEPLFRMIAIPNRWCIHSYYTLSPYAPDGSGRLLLAGADLERGTGEVLVTDSSGSVLDRFGDSPLNSSFYHTGHWQTWGPDGKSVYYRGGTLKEPLMIRRELATGREDVLEGDMEGAPPFGEPIISGLLGMLYAAGYGENRYQPEQAPVPFSHRDKHGLFQYSFPNPGEAAGGGSKLVLSIQDVLERHPDRDKLAASDREIRERLGADEGLTLMCYCVRWNQDGSRLLFYFGNHCVVASRQEPRLAYIFTADREFKEIHLAVDLSYGRRGVHWYWHPDGEHLLGYGPDPEQEGGMCLGSVRYDGSGYKKISAHASGGHPSISPADHNLLVTDESTMPGRVLLIDLREDRVIRSLSLPRVYGAKEPPGRNPFRVCHHPVFSRDGERLLINILPGRHAALAELNLKEALT
ncbi:MAG: hypothetical protein K0R57_645 [Paenibacillaceae bacterium]|jgi:hypothetical protein|nr:hypothetical protein [Paenibacillaceae bacterium]